MRASKVTHIDAHVDPRRLPAGVVVAGATDPGYGSILAAQDLGLAQPLGLSYDERGNQFIAAFVTGSRNLRPNAIAGRVEIGARFFTNAWKDYGGAWAACWWREALQNSIDGGARNIDCSVTEVTLPSGAKAYDVVVEDDGRGMSLDILQNKFLTLGETGKEERLDEYGQPLSGGFGKAKELLLFGWIEWEVHTRNLLAKGNGGIYNIDDDAPMRKGTRVRARMAADRFATEQDLNSALQGSYVSPRITFNGREKAADLRVSKLVAELAGGRMKVYTRKADFAWSQWGGLVVRLDNGLKMYRQPLPDGIDEYVVVVLQGDSTEMLQANRNVLSDEYRFVLDRWLNNLAKDIKSALKAKSTTERVRYKGLGKFRGVDPRAIKATLEDSLTGWGASKGKPITISPTQKREIEEALGAVEDAAPVDTSGEDGYAPAPAPPRTGLDLRMLAVMAAPMLDGTTIRGPESLTNVARLLSWEPDFLVYNEIEGFRVPSKFKPADMAPGLRKLARFWAEIVRLVLIRLNSSSTFSVGWHFDTSRATGTGFSLASYTTDDGDHFVLLNPFRTGDPKGELLSLSNPEDISDIVSRAIHEVTHLEYQISGHDEEFAASMSYVVKRVGNLWPQVNKVRAAVVARDTATGKLGDLVSKRRESSAAHTRIQTRIQYPQAAYSPSAIRGEFWRWRVTNLKGEFISKGDFDPKADSRSAIEQIERELRKLFPGKTVQINLWMLNVVLEAEVVSVS